MKREELKVYKLFGSRTSSSRFIDMYFKSEADEVMDAMEKQIRILENDNWRAACMAEIKGNHELAVKIIKTKITNSTEEK